MGAAQFQLVGRVIHVDAPVMGRRLRTISSKVLRLIVVCIIIPALMIGVAIFRLSVSLAASLVSVKSAPAHPGFFRDYVRDVLSHLTAKWIGEAGECRIVVVRVRDSANQIFPVRFEGQFVSGAVTAGDRVTVRMHVVEGVNLVTDGSNHTTGEAIRLRR